MTEVRTRGTRLASLRLPLSPSLGGLAEERLSLAGESLLEQLDLELQPAGLRALDVLELRDQKPQPLVQPLVLLLEQERHLAQHLDVPFLLDPHAPWISATYKRCKRSLYK